MKFKKLKNIEGNEVTFASTIPGVVQDGNQRSRYTL